MNRPVMVGWNQKYNLYIWAKEKGYMKIYNFLDQNLVTQKPMTYEKYKLIRNAILFNHPATALRLLQPYSKN